MNLILKPKIFDVSGGEPRRVARGILRRMIMSV
jgi:hypothetical protein